jgi:iron complex outermembrane recepter protein
MRYEVGIVGLLTTLCAASIANAQSVGSDALEEVVVTAQRRAQNLQDVPIAVAAITGESLARTGVTDVLDLRIAIPALNLTNSNGNLSTSLRGVGSNSVNAGFENPVALYVDGVYYAAQVAAFPAFNDIEQVEVLKGPQGTLFGRNATAGLIQITTRTPTQDTDVEASVSYGNYQTVDGNLYVGGGIAENLAADIAIDAKTMGEGWGKDLTTGRDVYKIDHDIALRSKWLWQATPQTKLTLIVDYSDLESSMNLLQRLPGTISGFPSVTGVQPNQGYDVEANVQPLKYGWEDGVSLKWDQQIGALTFDSITAYRQSGYTLQFDYDASAQPLESIRYNEPNWQASQEFQLTGNTGGPLTWVTGAYLFDAQTGLDPITLNLDDQGVHLNIDNTQKTRSAAAYGQGTYEIVKDTHLTLGVRYTYEEREAVEGSTTVFVVPLAMTLPAQAAADQTASFDRVTYRASLDHRFSEQTLGYVSFNTGFKSGGFNTGSPGTDPYLPETIKAYEVGLKNDLLDRRLRLNLAAYYYDYSNIQTQRLDEGVISIVNAGAARIYGLDADVTALVVSGLRLTGGLGLVDAKYTTYEDALLSNPLGGTPSLVGSAAGKQLPLASKITANIGAEYNYPLPYGSLVLAANAYYNSGYYLEADNAIQQGDFTQLGANLKWSDPHDRYWVAFYGKNLSNRQVLTFESTNATNGTHLATYGEPRTYGITFGVRM